MRIPSRRPALEVRDLNYAAEEPGKLGPNWEGLYIIIAPGGKRFTLADQDENQLRKQWNSFHLK